MLFRALHADADRACPVCGTAGRSVHRITVEAMLLPAALARLTARDHRFCATADCPVVYFGAADRSGRRRRRAGVSEGTSGSRTVCYCFGVAEPDLARELAAGGRPTAIERISALVKAGRCACEVKNPQGSCCLGNLAAAVGSLETERAERPALPDGRAGTASG